MIRYSSYDSKLIKSKNVCTTTTTLAKPKSVMNHPEWHHIQLQNPKVFTTCVTGSTPCCIIRRYCSYHLHSEYSR